MYARRWLRLLVRRAPFDTGTTAVNRAERFRGARILVIEDEPQVRAFIIRVLQLEGAAVVAASTGAAGLASIRDDGPFHLVTLDLRLPDISGWDVLDAIRARPSSLITAARACRRTACCNASPSSMRRDRT